MKNIHQKREQKEANKRQNTNKMLQKKHRKMPYIEKNQNKRS